MLDHDANIFSGGVFSERIDGGRASARIELREDGISARTERGQEFRLRYAECDLEMGGASGRMVFCRTPDRSLTIFCEDKQFPRALSESRWSGLQVQVEEILAKQRGERRRGRIFVSIGMVLLLSLVVGGYFGLKVAASAAVQAVPISVDQKIGKLAINSMELPGPDLDDEVVQEAVDGMVAKLAEGADIEGLEFEVHVIDAPVVNAFALPGGQIVVHTGLIEKCAEAEQLAGVLAHEMAHVTLRHGLERIGQSLGLAAAANVLLGDVEGIAVAGVELLEMATVNSYSRTQEADADAEGVRLMRAAGWDAMALASFFEVLKDEHGEGPDALSWISTHPQHDERIEAVEQQLQRLPPKAVDPINVDWEDIRRRVTDR